MNDKKWTVKLNEKKISIFGSKEGREFDDLDKIAEKIGENKKTLLETGKIKDIHVEKIRVWHGENVINSIQFSYKVTTDTETYSIEGNKHGGDDGREELINLESDEYISGIRRGLELNGRTDQLNFSTCKLSTGQTKLYGMYGGDGIPGHSIAPLEIRPTEGKVYTCFFGRSDNSRLFSLWMYEGTIINQKEEKIEKENKELQTQLAQAIKENKALNEHKKAVHDVMVKIHRRLNQAVLIDQEEKNNIIGDNWEEKLLEKTSSEVREEETRLIKKIIEKENIEKEKQKDYEKQIREEIAKAQQFTKNFNLKEEDSRELLKKLKEFQIEWAISSVPAKWRAVANAGGGEERLNKIIEELQIRIRGEEAIRLITQFLDQAPRLSAHELGNEYINFKNRLRTMSSEDEINDYENKSFVLGTSFRRVRARLNGLISSANQLLDNTNNSEAIQQDAWNLAFELEKFMNSSPKDADKSMWLAYLNNQNTINRLVDINRGQLYEEIRKQALKRLEAWKEKFGSNISLNSYREIIDQANLQKLRVKDYENDFLTKISEERQIIQAQIVQQTGNK